MKKEVNERKRGEPVQEEK